MLINNDVFGAIPMADKGIGIGHGAFLEPYCPAFHFARQPSRWVVLVEEHVLERPNFDWLASRFRKLNSDQISHAPFYHVGRSLQ